MPKTKLENATFTLITSAMMIFIMSVYNVALHTGRLAHETFGIALYSFPLDWFLGFMFALFIAGRLAKWLTFRLSISRDKPFLIILCIQTFTVCIMVPLMSMLGAIETIGFTRNLPQIWLQAIAFNFVMAYPLQILVVGPICRWIFRLLFR